MTIAYEKYETMNRRQLLNSLRSAEKKLDTLQKKFKIEQESQKHLIAFIKAKLKASLDTKYNFEPYEQTNSYRRIKAMSESEKAQIRAELEAEANND